MVVQIKKDFEFDGYYGNESQNASKIIRNVFKKGDAYFNSGDLFTLDKDHFVYFADRIGDTFRYNFVFLVRLETRFDHFGKHITARFKILLCFKYCFTQVEGRKRINN